MYRALTDFTTHNNMATGLTLQQLQTMGAKPVAAPAKTGGQTLAQLQTPTPASAAPPTAAPLTADSIWQSIVNATKQQIAGGEAEIAQPFIDKGTQQAQGIKETPAQAALGALKVGSGVASVVSSPFAELFKPVGAAVDAITNKISDIPAVQNFSQTPAGQATTAVAEPLSEAGNIAGTIVGAEELPKIPAKIGSVFDAAKEALNNPVPAVTSTSEVPVKTFVPAPQTVIPKTTGVVKQLLGIDGLGDQVKTSAQRLAADAPLIGGGAAREATPLDLYNKFVNQESLHLNDIKQDPAISMVGEKIGNAFQDVIKQKQAAGSTMADELDKTATKPVDTGPAFGEFQKELQSNGASYDSVDKQLSAGENSKFGESDKGLLERYGQALQELGTNPPMKALDAFISRVPQDIKTLKAKNGINFSTNAERIIGNSLNDLRTSLTKSGTPEYAAARTKYSELSQFVKNNAPLLGKITESGDFSHDASLAKSAVQSVLNNGKKDFLIKLEQHTAYKALDEANLALQAMKDMGDSKGNSLLELMNEAKNGGGELPGTIGKIIGTGGKIAGKLIAGDKVAQTRAYLKSLKKPNQ